MKSVVLLICAVMISGLLGCDDMADDYENSAGQTDKTPGGPSEPDNPAKDKKTGDEKDNPAKPLSVEERLAQVDFNAAPILGEVARQYYRIILEEDWAAEWEMLSKQSQASYGNRDSWYLPDLDPEQLQSISTPREFYVLRKSTLDRIDRLDPITSEEMAPDKKSGWLVNKGGRTYKFLKEDGEWKLSLRD